MKNSKACNFIKKETLAQVFSCEFCEIFKNTFSATILSQSVPPWIIAGVLATTLSILLEDPGSLRRTHSKKGGVF